MDGSMTSNLPGFGGLIKVYAMENTVVPIKKVNNAVANLTIR